MESSIYLKSVPLHVEGHENKLLKALHDQRRDGQLCDVSLVVENESFPAHKAVLASHSLYFQALFDQGKDSDAAVSKVCNVTTIHLSSISLNTFIPILHFLYTSKLHLFAENVRDVAKTGRKLQIDSIVQACERVMRENIALPSIHGVHGPMVPRPTSTHPSHTQSVLFVDLKSEDDDAPSHPPHPATQLLPTRIDNIDKQRNNRTLKKKGHPKKIDSFRYPPTPDSHEAACSVDNINTISPTSIFGRIGSQTPRRPTPSGGGRMISSTSDFTPLMFESSPDTIFSNETTLVVDDFTPDSVLLPPTFPDPVHTTTTASKTSESLQVQSVYSISPKLAKKMKMDLGKVSNINQPSVYTCKECLKYFTNVNDALQHYYAEHKLMEEDKASALAKKNTKVHGCPDCGRFFNNKNNLKRHILIKHTTDKRFKCSHCGRRYAIRQSLQYHMKSVHNKPDFPPTTSPSTSDVTSTYPTDQNRLVPINPSPFTPNRDEAISLGDSPMLDSQSYFNSVTNSGDPSLGKPNVPSIQCIESITSDTSCPSTCSMMGADKPYSGDAFVSRLPVLLPAFPSQRKVSHDLHQIASRVAPKLHRCDHCGHIFPSIQAYTRHKRACNKYECPICHRGFSQVGNMRRHTKIFHSDQKPFECKVCNKAYGIQQSFRYHMRDKHGIILGKSSKPDDK